MQSVIRHIILACLLLMSLYSCQFSIDDTSSEIIKPPIEISILSSFRGYVLDDEGNGLANVIVSVNNDEVLTNALGYFYYDEVPLIAKGQLINFERPGYFNNSKLIYPSLRDNYLECKLIQENLVATFQADIGAIIEFSGAEIGISPNILVDQNDETYTGQVDVKGFYISPDSSDLSQIMPIDLIGTDNDNQLLALSSLGMIYFEMLADNGEPLKVIQDGRIKIDIPISNNFLPTTPAEVPVWKISENRQYWVNVTDAILEANKLVFYIDNPGWWSANWSFDGVDITTTISGNRNGDYLPITHASIGIKIDERPWIGTEMYVNQEGVSRNIVPANVPMELVVKNVCQEIDQTKTWLIVSEPSNNLQINIDYEQSTLVNIRTVLVDCDKNPINNALLVVRIDDDYAFIEANVNGVVYSNIPICDEIVLLEISTYQSVQQMLTNTGLFVVDDVIDIDTLIMCP